MFIGIYSNRDYYFVEQGQAAEYYRLMPYGNRVKTPWKYCGFHCVTILFDKYISGILPEAVKRKMHMAIRALHFKTGMRKWFVAGAVFENK